MESIGSQSPWPKRILISGVCLVFLGIILTFTYASDIPDYYDPRNVSDHQAQIDDVNSFSLNGGCWVVFVEGSKENYDVDFNHIEDGTIGKSVSGDWNTDYFAQTADVDFTQVAKLNIKETSNVSVSIDCKEDGACENKLYLVNGDQTVVELLSEPSLLITCGICFTGLVLIPIGWLIMVINKGQSNEVQFINDPNVTMNTEFEQGVVENHGEMLTTDDLYRLVRGELPEAEPKQVDVPSPFADSDTRVSQVKPTTTGGSINKASGYTPENLPKDDSWKNWDEG